MTASRRSLLVSLVLAAGLLIGWAAPHTALAAFDLQKGIVGNLALQCREQGICTWCDFISLMVVLQKVILSLFGGLALIMLVVGGQIIITAAGSQERITKGKKLITSTLLGVAIVLAAYFLINVIVGLLITPRGEHALRTDLFGNNWWQAQCANTDKMAPTFCRGQSDGTLCGDNSGNFVCKNERECVVSCKGIVWDSHGARQGTCVPTGPCTPPATATTDYCQGGQVCCVQ